MNIVLFLLICSCSLKSTEVSALSQIPKEDRTRIEKLFYFLFWNEAFAYVLFGSKPMSVCTQPKVLPGYNFEDDPSPLFELESLWKTWEQYEHLFPMNEFIFLIENNDKWFCLNLLNKSNCLKLIEANLTIFREKTGLSLNAAGMFDHIVANAGSDIYKNSLGKSQGLYGLLLGFGRKNALGFEHNCSKKSDPLPDITSRRDCEDPTELPIPFFASFSAEETHRLLADYRKQRDEILKIYAGRDFLEVTINRLTMKGL